MTSENKRKILPPKVDVVFKLLFGDERNIDILVDFLKSILNLEDDEYEHISISDPHLKRERIKDKLGIVDVKLKSKSGKIIHIEVQVLEQEEMPERVAYYNAKMFTSQLKSGSDFDTLKKTISIVITDFEMIKSSGYYHHTFQLNDKAKGVSLTDLIEINTLELVKIPNKSDNTAKYDWLQFLKSEKEEEFDMLAVRSPSINKAVAELKRLSQTERAQTLYESREKALRDERSRIVTAHRQGKREGIIEGMQKGVIEGKREEHQKMVAKLIKRGDSASDIADFLEITVEEVENIKNEVS